MSTQSLPAASVTARREVSQFRLAINAVRAIAQRDLVVTAREIVQFLLQAMIQPLLS